MTLPDHFNSDIGLKADYSPATKRAFISGYITTDELDTNREIVTPAAMKAMVEQLKSGRVKLDVEHETFLGKADVPIGRIVEAEHVYHEGKNKIAVKAELNTDHARFAEVWGSIQKKFIDAFSIAYKVKSTSSKVMNGVTAKVLDLVDLLNVALTGNPVNRGCSISESFTKSLASSPETYMSEEQTQPVIEPVVAEAVQVKSVEAVEAELKSHFEAQLKSHTDTITELQTQLKSIVDAREADQKVIAELKAIVEAPQLKSTVQQDKVEAIVMKSPLAYIK